MNYLLPALAAALIAAGCAATTESTSSSENAVDCRNVDAPTGTRLVRRADCAKVPAPTQQGAIPAPRTN